MHKQKKTNMRFKILFFLIFTSTICFAQKDTLYLFENYVELNGHKYNIADNGIKTGKWIEHTIINNDFSIVSEYESTSFEYRPLKHGEFYGCELVLSEKIFISKNRRDTTYSRTYVRILNKVPQFNYIISEKGIYKNNKKEGKWKYYYKNGKLRKKIHYKNGLPNKGFKVYRPDGKIMMKLIKIENDVWELVKYLETGAILSRERIKTKEFEDLY